MYADDTVLRKSDRNLDLLCTFLNYRMLEFCRWCSYNRLCLNANKTKFMIFRLRSMPLDVIFSLSFNGNSIERVSAFRYLGFTVSENLKHYDHISNLCSRLSKIMGLCYKLRYYLDIHICRIFYFSAIHSVYAYGIVVWGALC